MANYYQYETSPRKLKPEYKPRKKQKSKQEVKKTQKKEKVEQVKAKKVGHRKTVIYVILAFAILFTISYRNSLIAESFNKTKELKANLANIQKENEQLEVSVESNLNLNNIEQSAKELLGMSKLDQTKKVYISLPRQDYIEPASEEIIKTEDENWFKKTFNALVEKIR